MTTSYSTVCDQSVTTAMSYYPFPVGEYTGTIGDNILTIRATVDDVEYILERKTVALLGDYFGATCDFSSGTADWSECPVVIATNGMLATETVGTYSVKIETVDRVQGLTVDYCIFFIPNASLKYSLEKELWKTPRSQRLLKVAPQLLCMGRGI